jgi:hypothetical protein
MLKIWNFKNTFTNKLLPYSYSYLNNNFISQKKKDFSLTFGKVTYSKNTEIINHYISFIDRPHFNSCVTIEENDWVHPFPHGYIPNNVCDISTSVTFKDKYNNLRDTIQERISINLHKPSPYKINGTYHLIINNKKIANNIYYEVPMDFRGTHLYEFADDKQIRIFMNKLSYYLNNSNKQQ